jgi:hypothetical protein
LSTSKCNVPALGGTSASSSSNAPASDVRGALIGTSNKPFRAWGGIFGDDVAAAATIDRLVHQAEILGLQGDSYRLKARDLARHGTPLTDAHAASAAPPLPTGAPPRLPPRSFSTGPLSTGATGPHFERP